ncbi:hypothetical protein T4D_745 [Trichinella pseudospiralis]|uniref:Uncharacterized protein n=1 Tax=Trichinella pseudospiralis TaxID=6337 RepID=A0A0V1G594_TRIPS|nr:hypothetical protein T4D_745 [Trichinella pseudospiralis]
MHTLASSRKLTNGILLTCYSLDHCVSSFQAANASLSVALSLFFFFLILFFYFETSKTIKTRFHYCHFASFSEALLGR